MINLCLIAIIMFFVLNYTATTDIYTYCHTLSQRESLPNWDMIKAFYGRIAAYDRALGPDGGQGGGLEAALLRNVFRDAEEKQAEAARLAGYVRRQAAARSEEHTSELQSLMRNSYAVFCLKKKKTLARNLHSYTLMNR